jgi:DNA-binding response OmpR family regulator
MFQTENGARLKFFVELSIRRVMLKVLIAESDELSIKTMKEALSTHEVEIFASLGPLLDRLSASPADLLILDNALLDKGFGAWLEDFRKNCKIETNKNIKIIIMSFQDEPLKVRQFMKAGATDYVIKPIDRPLFMQKMSLYLSSQVEKQVYAFQTATAIDIAREVKMDEISEFGLTLHTADPIAENDILTFYSSVFKTDTRDSVMARCYKLADSPENKNEKIASFVFVGVNQATLKQIRNWMKHEYIRKKQQAA